MTAAVLRVVIPVYNALSQTARCVDSVVSATSLPFELVIVNDRSDETTSAELRRISSRQISGHCVGMTLLENEQNLGFLLTANRGLFAETAPAGEASLQFTVILNSDTVVTSGWAEAFQRCFAADQRIGLATPVSNNAENLSHPIPEGHSCYSMAEILSSQADAKSVGYSDIATAIGFCMGIRTAVLHEVGGFDEIFSPGYAEDSDLHYKVLSRGYRSVLVHDAFVYHESHASFSENKARLVARNRPVFDQRWSTIYTNDLAAHDRSDPLAVVRKQVNESPSPVHDVAFIIPTAKLFGGIVVVYEVINRMLARGINATAIVLEEPRSIDMQLLFTPYFRPDRMWDSELPRAKAYVATHFETVAYAHAAAAQYPDSKLVYLMQGYEAWFPGATVDEVVQTYRAIPNRVAVSKWVSEMVARWDCSSIVIPNGVDNHFFYPATPSAETAKRPPTLLTLLRNDPQGGYRLAFNILRRVKELHPDLRVVAVGDLSDSPPTIGIVDESFRSADRKQMKAIYQRSDIFLDCSMVQGFGLMGLEAMASGVAVVTGDTGGVREYAHTDNSMLVPLGDESGFVDAILTLLHDKKKVQLLAEKGRETASLMNWDSAAEQYAAYFSKIDDLAPLSVEHLRANAKYLFERNRILREQARLVAKATQSLSAELRGSQVTLTHEERNALGCCITGLAVQELASAAQARMMAEREISLQDLSAAPAGSLAERVRRIFPV